MILKDKRDDNCQLTQSAPAVVDKLQADGLPCSLAGFRNFHANETILVCGCGASLNELTNPQEFITIGVNDVGRKFNPTYLVVLNPRNQFKQDRFSYVEQSHAQAIFTQLDLSIRHHRIVRFKLGQRGGTDLSDPNRLPYTRNSPYVALCLAIHMGAKKIGLIGVDFTDGHFFAPTGLHPLTKSLSRINEEYAHLAKLSAEMGVEILNLSSQSRLTAFPKLDLLSFFNNMATSRHKKVQQARSECPSLLIVYYQFLSCGDVFTRGLENAARELNVRHTCASWDDRNLPMAIERFSPDLLLVIHGRKFRQRWGNRFRAYRSAVWLLDEPYEVDDTVSTSALFDYVFLNDPSTLERHHSSRYLPVAYDPYVHAETSAVKRYDVGFIGGYNPVREKFLLSLIDAGLLSYVVGGPWKALQLKKLCLARNISPAETAALYQQTRIVVNVFRDRHHFNRQNIPAWSLNPRVYEALACGALVVSERRPEMGEVFPDLPTFSTADELVDIVRKQLDDSASRDQVLAGCRHGLGAHTYANRLAKVLDISLSRQNHKDEAGTNMSNRISAERISTVEHAQGGLPKEWVDCGSVTRVGNNGEITLTKNHDNRPGAEQGLASENIFTDITLAFEVYLSDDAVFLAKIHQLERLDQSSNSFHLCCRPGHVYVAMHHRILAETKIGRNRWVPMVLSWERGILTLICDGTRAVSLREGSLPAGYCFLGLKGGRVRLRNLQMTVPEYPLPKPPDQDVAAPPEGWTVYGLPPRTSIGDRLVIAAPSDDETGTEVGLASDIALTQLELSFQLKLDVDTAFIAKIHCQDRGDSASNSYHLISTPEHGYLAKHNVIFQRVDLERGSWQSIVLRRMEHSRIELVINGARVVEVLDNQLQSGFCFLGVVRGQAELRGIRLRDLAEGVADQISADSLNLKRTEASAPPKSRIEQLPFSDMPIRNLIYHIWPVKGSMWRWNLDQLKQRIELFNGRRLIGIVYDDRSAPPEAVMDALDGHGCEFYVRPNDTHGEAITFPHFLREITSLDRNEVTFYGHAKGVKYEPNVPETVKHWSEVQYHVSLDNWLEVKEQMELYALTGPFRMLGRFRTHHNLGGWHYSGTNFWMRHASVFSRDCLDIPQFYGGVEAWPGIFFKQSETGCLFLDQLRQLPYHASFWSSKANPALEHWEAKRRGVEPPLDLVEPLPFHGFAQPRVEQKPEELDWWISKLIESNTHQLLTIGAMHGGIEWHIARIFHEEGKNIEITTVDLNPSTQAERTFEEAKTHFRQKMQLISGDSSSPEVRKRLADKYDAVFIDGDHSYRGAHSDWLLAKSLQARLIGFHDIVDSDWHIQCQCCVSRLWIEIKKEHRTQERSSGVWGGLGIVTL